MKVHKSITGFTLVEIMIVVAIVGLLASIAIPNFLLAREETRTTSCLNNLRLISSAKEQAALELDLDSTSAIPTVAQLDVYIRGGYSDLECPVDGDTGTVAYPLSEVTTLPTCTNNASNHVVNDVL